MSHSALKHRLDKLANAERILSETTDESIPELIFLYDGPQTFFLDEDGVRYYPHEHEDESRPVEGCQELNKGSYHNATE